MSTYSRFFSMYNKATKAGAIAYEGHGELVHDWTKGRTSSLRDLSPLELRRIERRIEELMDPVGASMQRQRRKIIAILAERGATKDGKPDMEHIQAWVLKYGYLHKELNAYTPNELPRLVTQAEAIVGTDLQAVRRNG